MTRIYREEIQKAASSLWNIRDDIKGLPLDELRDIQKQDSFPYAVCAVNITGDLNVGIIIRTSLLMGAERIFVFGRRRYDKRSTVGAHNYIDVVRVDGMLDEMTPDRLVFDQIMDEYGYSPIFVEHGGTPVSNHSVDFNTKPCYVFGNEGMGLEPEFINGRPIVSIPQRGVLRSFNVSTSAGIVLHTVMNQFMEQENE